VHDQLVEALALAIHQAELPQPLGRDPAGRGLALADLVAIDDHHVGAGTRKLTCDRKSGEARPAYQDVVSSVEGSALLAALGRSNRHRLRFCHYSPPCPRPTY